MSSLETDRDRIDQALERLLSWPEVARSPQLARFLGYIVERRLSGDTQSIKAYSIAVDVFGRSPDFDPQSDPIVRVQARRLRGLLDQYYRGPGSDEPVRIELPIGRYVPEFVDAQTAAAPLPIGREPSVRALPASQPKPKRPKGHVTLPWFLLLLLALGAAALTYSLSTWGPQRGTPAVAQLGALQMPRLRIMEFQNLTGDASLTPTIAALAVELVTDFTPVLIVDAAFGGRGTVGVDPDRQNDFVLTGVVRNSPQPDSYEFDAILTDADANIVVWNWSETVPRIDITERGGIDLVSQELISRMGGPRGALHAEARALLARTDIEGRENGYLCAILFSMYRTAPTSAASARVLSCLDALPEDQQANGNILAARASLVAEAQGDGNWRSAEQAGRYDEASALMERALRIAPTSSFAWEQQARLYEATGHHADAEAAYSTSLQLNTANIDAAAAHGRHLALIGRLDLAMPLARRSLDALPVSDTPSWFNCVPAMKALADRTFIRAERLAQQCARVDAELGSVLLLLAAHTAGDSTVVRQSLPTILEVQTFRSSGIMPRLERRITDRVLLSKMRAALLDSGVPEANLVSAY
ncbi:Tfp pilus assembly protein PilF [Devosia lucknowensis]|uniref:Tfp pilus assembly protein PilF n=1 Tax=Devosia lucknowensis TaxID=1096929 RepID=A0A1Y6FGP4_9HYPH|nr:hypothetical protein [Devosia lucknowensis]SMQ72042.1 Tfp pilus assembly protein PilF [Devosia lucknowensis]